ncbi:hypothetical protein LQT47_24575 [Escherichia coli]|nr:hypothetical protein LQT47_24575 [Escherichia coli]
MSKLMIVLVVLLSLAVAGLFLAKHEKCQPARLAGQGEQRRHVTADDHHHAEKSASCCPHQGRQKRAGAGGTASGAGERREA